MGVVGVGLLLFAASGAKMRDIYGTNGNLDRLAPPPGDDRFLRDYFRQPGPDSLSLLLSVPAGVLLTAYR